MDSSDPNRCQASDRNGQCPNLALEGTKHCQNHDGGRELSVAQKRSLIIRDASFAERVDQLSKPNSLQSLETEIGIISSLMEEALQSCKDSVERSANAPRVASLIDQLSRLKVLNLKMAQQHGELLARSAVIDLAKLVAEILSEEIGSVPDSVEIVDRVVKRLAEVIMKSVNEA